MRVLMRIAMRRRCRGARARDGDRYAGRRAGTAARSHTPAQLSASTRATLERLIDSARVAGLPVDPLYSKVREGVFRSADDARVIAAVQRLGRDLGDARSALGDSAAGEEIAAGANALRAGIKPADCRGYGTRVGVAATTR